MLLGLHRLVAGTSPLGDGSERLEDSPCDEVWGQLRIKGFSFVSSWPILVWEDFRHGLDRFSKIINGGGLAFLIRHDVLYHLICGIHSFVIIVVIGQDETFDIVNQFLQTRVYTTYRLGTLALCVVNKKKRV